MALRSLSLAIRITRWRVMRSRSEAKAVRDAVTDLESLPHFRVRVLVAAEHYDPYH